MSGPLQGPLLAELARWQHGPFSSEQLAELGLGHSGISRRVDTGRLHRRNQGVYTLGPEPLSRYGRWMASVLACGPGSALSHRDGGELLGMRRLSNRTIVDVTTPQRVRRPGIRAHGGRLDVTDIVYIDHIPCTSPRRTILDLADSSDRVGLEDALARAEQERLDFGADFRAYLDAMNGRRGTGVLQVILDDQERLQAMSDSDLELAAVRMFDDHTIVRPHTQVWLPEFADSPTPYRADFLWEGARVILETDGFGEHGGRTRFESDRLRAQDLMSVDYVVVPATWRQIVFDPGRVAPGLKTVLERETRRRTLWT